MTLTVKVWLLGTLGISHKVGGGLMGVELVELYLVRELF